MKTITQVLLLAVVLLAGCTTKPDRFQAYAKDFCTCLKPMVELQQKFMQLSSEGKEDELMELLMQGQQMDQESQACVAGLEAKHGTIETEEDENKMMEAMRKACPDIALLLEEAAKDIPDNLFEDGDMFLDEDAVDEEQ